MKYFLLFFLFLATQGQECSDPLIIDNYTNPGIINCVDYCPSIAPFINNFTNSGKPICVPQCPKEAKYEVTSERDKEWILCEQVCPPNLNVAYVSERYICLETCPIIAPFIDKNVCLVCPLSAPYIDKIIDIDNPKCLSQCKPSAPYIYLQPQTSPKCLVSCPEDVPYVDMTQERLTCVTECPEGTTLITDSVSQYQMCFVDKFPGEYGDHKLCSDKTPGCAECNPITGECQRCLGFYGILEGNVCQCPSEQYVVCDLTFQFCLALQS